MEAESLRSVCSVLDLLVRVSSSAEAGLESEEKLSRGSALFGCDPCQDRQVETYETRLAPLAFMTLLFGDGLPFIG